jgi:alcohol dehydrogenase
MRAAQFSNYGGPEVIKITEKNTPVPSEGQLLVRVQAAAINPFDAKLRNGIMKEAIPLELPVTIGGDFSGIVTKEAEGVTEFKAGDEVYGSANILGGGSGSVAEYAAANLKNIARKPANLTHEEAAAIVLVGVSAYDVIDKLNLSEGKMVLIQGGAGGIGSAAIQYAKSLGAYVATTARSADKDFVIGLGADQVIDYENELFENLLQDFDAVFDTVGGKVYTRSFGILKSGGIIISMNETPNEQLALQYGVTAFHQNTKVNSDALKRLAELVEKKIITPQIDKTFPLHQAAEAFKHMETGSPRGKVVIQTV